MQLNILADENIPAVEHFLGAVGGVQRVDGRSLAREQLAEVDILLVRSVTRVNADLLKGTRIKFVGSATSGFDHIDRSYLEKHGIAFAYAPGSNANAVVEYVLAAIAAVGDQLEQLLAGGKVGIIGYGTIGKALAKRFAALGISYRVYDPWLDQAAIPHAADLDGVLECEVVSLHPELTTAPPWPSHHLLGAAQLRQLRPGSLLINASRGAVVDNAALRTLLASGRGPNTVLDVWEGEPVIDRDLLHAVTLGTAHIAGYSLDGKLLATRMLSAAVATALQLPPLALATPLPTAAALAVPAGMIGAELIRYLVRAGYDIRLDDALLRNALPDNHSAADRGRHFDALRRDYRERRELAGSLVSGPLQSGQKALVQALGCIPDADGASP